MVHQAVSYLVVPHVCHFTRRLAGWQQHLQQHSG